jgi:hypothetical protein
MQNPNLSSWLRAQVNPMNSDVALKVGVASAFACIALVLRFAPLPENFGCFGALCVFCGFVLTGASRWLVPLVSFFLADCVGHFLSTTGMGFYHVPSMVLNYVGFAAMILIGLGASRLFANEKQQWLPWAGVVGTSIVASIAFFLISNFGAWLDPLLGYEQTLSGLMRSYVMGLPFFQTTLVSDVVFGVGFYASYQFIKNAVAVSRWLPRN